MKRYVPLLALLLLGLGVAACDDNTPTTPSSESVRFTAALLPANEVPPIIGAEAAGSATSELTFHLTRDAASTITAATLDVTVSATGFPPGTTLTAAHIHPGVPGVSGGIFVSLGLTAGEISFANGGGSFSKNAIAVPADQANAILANPAGFYLNIHTSANLNGVARGQLTRIQ
jgi:hypothetical protein